MSNNQLHLPDRMSRSALLLVRLRTRLLEKCTQHVPKSLSSGLLHTSTSRQLHTTPSVFVSGAQRKQFAEELQQKLKKDDLLGSGKGKLDFEKVLVETGGERERRKRDYPDNSRDNLEEQVEQTESSGVETTSEQHEVISEVELSPELDSNNFDIGNHFDAEVVRDMPEFASEDLPEESSENVPVNIMGDLESLFSDITPPEPVVSEQVCFLFYNALSNFLYSLILLIAVS